MTRASAGRDAARPGRWDDLGQRAIYAVALAVIGVGAIFLGGLWFTIFTAIVVGVIVWELSAMADADAPIIIAAVAAICCLVVTLLPAGYGLPLVMLPALVSSGRLPRLRLPHALFTVLTVLAGYGLADLRAEFAAGWLIWMVMIVVATDVAGYFAGRLIGGPRFWPKISPKKTWSGTVAGWIAAALVGLVPLLMGVAEPRIIAISVALSMAAQMGDIAESAVKRSAGVKDSSTLLPGHGGFFDRFDGVLGAALLLLIVQQLVVFPPDGP